LRYWSKWLFVFVLAWVLIYWHFAADPVALLSSNWPFIVLGFAAAILGNISAVGGGLVFIPSMMFFFRLQPVLALKVALLSQCFGMPSGAIGWLQRQKIPAKSLWLTVPGLLFGSTISSLVIHPSALLVKAFFGPISILVGIVTLISVRRSSPDGSFNLSRPQTLLLALVSVLGGLITGWVAIGEGELVSAFLMLICGVTASFSITLGVVLLAINSIFLALIHQFFLNGLPWSIGCFTGLGCVFGARLAPFLGQKLQTKTLKYCFAAIAIGDGLLFVFQYWYSWHLRPH